MGFLDVILHLDVHLLKWVAEYGTWIYAILFAVIFCETGLVVTPFLPGDSLLFVAGAIAAAGEMNVHLLFALLAGAAFLGNAVNYSIGRWLGHRLFRDNRSRFLNPQHLEKAHAFYERHGGKAVVISRFLPIIRTYVPFVAGMARMHPREFLAYNAGGAVLWAGGLLYAGYFFGNIPWIRGNLTAIIVGIVVVSLAPLLWAFVRSRFGKP
ncbi:MAG TPA: DedA family protein [Usitatibacter sp.]|nr:DedA family protein [Usitatibacter sp.]